MKYEKRFLQYIFFGGLETGYSHSDFVWFDVEDKNFWEIYMSRFVIDEELDMRVS